RGGLAGPRQFHRQPGPRHGRRGAGARPAGAGPRPPGEGNRARAGGAPLWPGVEGRAVSPEPVIAVFAGGTSPEREVSLGSGRACALALARSHPTRLFQLDADALPTGLDPARHVVFSTLHGTFGEDGGMQALLERAGVAYAGCGAASSSLTMDKSRTKAAAAARGVRGAASLAFP